MPRIKMPRSSSALDMTPMVDLAFLLVTFFMLTASFRLADPVKILTPSAHSEDLLPDNVLIVKVDKNNHAFIDINGFGTRKAAIVEMGKKYKLNLKINYNYQSKVTWLGLFGQVEYKSDKITAFLTFTGNQTNIPAGNYTLTVTDANSCAVTRTATVIQPATLTFTSSKTDVACNGASTGSINLTTTGGTPSYNYV